MSPRLDHATYSALDSLRDLEGEIDSVTDVNDALEIRQRIVDLRELFDWVTRRSLVRVDELTRN